MPQFKKVDWFESDLTSEQHAFLTKYKNAESLKAE